MWLWSEHIDKMLIQKLVKSTVLMYPSVCLEVKDFTWGKFSLSLYLLGGNSLPVRTPFSPPKAISLSPIQVL